MHQRIPKPIEKSGAALVIATAMDGLLLVKDPKFRDSKLKFPGGGVEPGESHHEAAVRELEEETGLVAEIEESDMIFQNDYGDHVKSTFRVVFPGFFRHLKARGDEGEEVHVIPLEDVEKMRGDILPGHYKVLKKLGIV